MLIESHIAGRADNSATFVAECKACDFWQRYVRVKCQSIIDPQQQQMLQKQVGLISGESCNMLILNVKKYLSGWSDLCGASLRLLPHRFGRRRLSPWM